MFSEALAYERFMGRSSRQLAPVLVRFADYREPFLGRQGPAGAHVASLSTGERDELMQRLRKRLLGEGGDRPFTLEARAWAVRGVVSASGNE